jgi:hypothetical protein
MFASFRERDLSGFDRGESTLLSHEGEGQDRFAGIHLRHHSAQARSRPPCVKVIEPN